MEKAIILFNSRAAADKSKDEVKQVQCFAADSVAPVKERLW